MSKPIRFLLTIVAFIAVNLAIAAIPAAAGWTAAVCNGPDGTATVCCIACEGPFCRCIIKT